jgi:hypothetical protein
LKPIYIKICLLLSTALVGTGFMMFHEFHVSLTEIRYNTQSRCFEVSLRIFPDDADRALKERAGRSLHLVTEMEGPEADSLLELYLLENFKLMVNGKEVPLSYLGKEPEADAMWCYLESEPMEMPRELVVRNSVLTRIFEDQVNIIQTYVESWNRGLLLSREHPEERLEVGR